MSQRASDAEVAALHAAYPALAFAGADRGDVIVSNEKNARGDVVRVSRHQKYRLVDAVGKPVQTVGLELAPPADAKDARIAALEAENAKLRAGGENVKPAKSEPKKD